MEGTIAKEARIGDWISDGFKLFSEQWPAWVLLSLGLFVAVAVPIILFIFFAYAAMIAAAVGQSASGTSTAGPLSGFLFVGGFFLVVIITLPLSALLTGGMYRAALKQLRGGKIEFGDLFSARDRYLPLLGAMLLQALLVSIGSLLCIIPGFIVAGLLFFMLPLVVERNLGVLEAMRLSVDTTKENWLSFTLFAFLVQLIASAGSLACYIGLLATFPLMFTMGVAAYRDCFGVEGAALPPAPEQLPARTYAPPAVAPSPTPAPAAAPAQRVCSNCQSTLPPSARFCFRCGTPAPEQ